MTTATKKKADPRRGTSIPWQTVPCPKCRAEVDERCRADSGRATDPHTLRLQVAQKNTHPGPTLAAVRPSPARMPAARPAVKTGVTLADYRALEDRITRGASALDSLRVATSDFSEHQRLMGKADGMRLALSYLKDVGPS